MKKIISIVALALIVLLGTSAYTANDSLAVGDKAPALSLSNGNSSFDLYQDLATAPSRDSLYVLVTFWSSADAQSRIDCNRYAHAAEALSRLDSTGEALVSDAQGAHNQISALPAHARLRHIAVNFDSQPVLFQEIVRLDRLDGKSQFHVSGPEAEAIRLDYGISDGYGSVLIGPDGRIVAFNPALRRI